MSPDEQIANHAWNLFGGEIHWPAVPWLATMLGVTDLDLFIKLLTTIRNHRRDHRE